MLWSKHNITIQRVRAHNGMLGNKIANQLANEGTTRNKPTSTPNTHIATSKHHREIHNLQIKCTSTKTTTNKNYELQNPKFTYVDNHVFNEQINQQLSNTSWKPQANRLIHGKPPKEHMMATNISQPQLTLCQTTTLTRGHTYSPLAPTHT